MWGKKDTYNQLPASSSTSFKTPQWDLLGGGTTTVESGTVLDGSEPERPGLGGIELGNIHSTILSALEHVGYVGSNRLAGGNKANGIQHHCPVFGTVLNQL